MTARWRRRVLGAALVILVGGCGSDQPSPTSDVSGVVQAGDLELSDGYVTEPVLGDIATAYVTIRNFGTLADTLLEAATPAAGEVTLHAELLEGGPSLMQPIERIVIDGGKTVALVPGGYHLMLLDLRSPIAAGDSVTIEFRFARAGRATIRVPVIPHVELVHQRSGERARPA